MKHHLIIALCISWLSVTLCHSQDPQPLKRELRAVWIATVENIDWPSKSGLPVEQQKAEMIELLELANDYHLNTVIFQIRPAADAFYNSSSEPWSAWLTGEQGKPPDPFYDPLQFTIDECRKRGLDIHVWINPYRAIRDTATSSVSPEHITQLRPDLFLTYGPTVYFNPGLPETRDYISHITSEIVRNYDIDAVHMDDYFYPYRIADLEFPDDSAFHSYPMGFSPEQKDDWRRNNVDLIIRQIYDSIKAVKPHVQFGISPFGVWRNSWQDSLGSATNAGQTNYDDLYSDVLKWQREGWIDYIAPQLYWQIGMKTADYAVLADWWSRNTYGCPLFVGQAIYRINSESKVEAWQSSDEIIRQIQLNRSLPYMGGSIFFSAKYLRSNPGGLKENLLNQVYQTKALCPVNPRIVPVSAEVPRNPVMTIKKDTVYLNWDRGTSANKYYVIYKFRKNTPALIQKSENITGLTGMNSFKIKRTHKTRPGRFYYGVTALSTTQDESELAIFVGK